jgi:hypothetical protein
MSGFSQQYISGLEQGRRNPTVVTLYETRDGAGREPCGACQAMRLNNRTNTQHGLLPRYALSDR